MLIAGSARPKTDLVEGQPFPVDSAKHHGAQATVSYGQRFQPSAGGLPIPQGKRRAPRRLRFSDEHRPREQVRLGFLLGGAHSQVADAEMIGSYSVSGIGR